MTPLALVKHAPSAMQRLLITASKVAREHVCLDGANLGASHAQPLPKLLCKHALASLLGQRLLAWNLRASSCSASEQSAIQNMDADTLGAASDKLWPFFAPFDGHQPRQVQHAPSVMQRLLPMASKAAREHVCSDGASLGASRAQPQP